MSTQPHSLQLPASLQAQLHDFRRRVWTIKSIEAAGGALCGVVFGYLAVYLFDRVLDTPVWLRLVLFLGALSACVLAPLYLHRWIWRQRTWDQLARLLSRTHPSIGDQMLGIIELVRNEYEQARSRALCQAAIQQVAEEAQWRDFSDAVPKPRHRFWIWMAAAPAAVALLLVALYPSAAMNAWSRFITPWRAVPRYTFTAISPLPERLVVPHGEAVTIPVRLLENSRWQPAEGQLQLGSQAPIIAELREGRYEFALPPQIDATRLKLAIGDARQRVELEPMLRPELSSVMANIKLPEYLGRPQPLMKDIRGGMLSLVEGSVASFTAKANRNLAGATIDGQQVQPSGATLAAAPQTIDASRKLVLEWQDEFGLSGQMPFTLSISARQDEPPTLSSEGLPRMRVVLDSETLSFKVRAGDDFGVKQVGLMWKGVDGLGVAKPAEGERLLATGGYDQESLELAATFCAQTLSIEPQPLEVRLYAEDYKPGRERTFSQPFLLYVLTAEQHAIWLTEQLSKWHRQSLEVRDREMQLHHTNQQLRLLDVAELDRPEVRRQIENQSAAERANGRRLTGLVAGGEELVRQAMRNPEFGVGHLEKWAEMLAILKDIAGNRMPNVADLLKQSAQSPGALAKVEANRSPMAGQVRSGGGGNSQPKDAEQKPQPKPPVPQVVDAESSHRLPPKDAPASEPGNSNSQPRLGLPVTTVTGAPPKEPQESQPPAAQKLDEAVKAQADLLAEFDKIAEELNRVLANLEGSTLVKRLKAASRKQYVIAAKIGEQVSGAFGQRNKVAAGNKEVLEQLSGQEQASSQDISHIMDDMEAYFERRRYQRFKTVLDEMRKQDAVGSLRQLGDDLKTETGLSIAQCEFWSDTFDRWADDLVDPACCGKCPGGKSRASLPPSVVLEAMLILEAEVNLREETRVTQQARAGLEAKEYGERANQLSKTQAEISQRVAKLAERIRELPDGEEEFAFEIGLLGQVEEVMDEATQILNRPDTGPAAIGAETEAIELLLQSKRINPRGGGGGGSSPGGGGGGDTLDSALALLGAGYNEQEVREERDPGQATGNAGTSLPEEFRAGLDEYFNRLERGRAQ
jgi:hypothetical protein